MEEIMELITIRQAADQLKVHPNTIRNYIKQGKLESIVFSSQTVRIQQSLVDNLKGNK
jgi:excisionase family DNA binding protein